MIDVDYIRSQFPAIQNHPQVIYFDNASTTQKPQSVLDAVSAYHHLFCSNSKRSTHDWALKSTSQIEQVRKQVASYLGLESTHGIYFTSGATQASQDLAYYWTEHFLAKSSKIFISPDEHKSMVNSWKKANSLSQNQYEFINITTNNIGTYDLSILDKTKSISEKSVVVLNHIHNVYGLEMGISEARQIVPAHIPIILDVSQSIGHLKINPKSLGVQALYFSGHKMYGLSGVGVLWIDDKYLLKDEDFESGTLNIEGVISLGHAIKYIENIGLENIQNYLLSLTQYTIHSLKNIPKLEFLPGPAHCKCASGHGIISFKILGKSSSEIADWLNANNIYVRSGRHCSSSETITDSVRISLQIYNTKAEIDKLTQVLEQI